MKFKSGNMKNSLVAILALFLSDCSISMAGSDKNNVKETNVKDMDSYGVEDDMILRHLLRRENHQRKEEDRRLVVEQTSVDKEEEGGEESLSSSVEEDEVIDFNFWDPSNNVQSRIVGGSNAGNDEFNSFVNLGLGCGGSLISPNLVLTAAHCLQAAWNPAAWVGAKKRGGNLNNGGGTLSKIAALSVHPQYDIYENNYDFALLRLEDIISNVPIQRLNTNINIPSDGDDLIVIGMGTTSQGGPVATRLQKVTIPYVSESTCRRIYGRQVIDIQSMLCAGSFGRDSCQGDSGAPLLDERTGNQVGVVSFGVGCGAPGFPGVYSRVTGAMSWIIDQICLHAPSLDPDLATQEGDNFILPSECLQQNRYRINFEIRYDSYAGETSWNIKHTETDDIFVIVPRGSGSPGRTVTSLNLLPGNYTFEIEDTAGDGICCRFGNGQYTISSTASTSSSSSNSDIINRSGDFGVNDIVTFEVNNDGSIIEHEYIPNINDGNNEIRVDIRYDLLAYQTSWKIINTISNEIIFTSMAGSQNFPGLISTRLNLNNGEYKFIIEDIGENGICCWFGFGYIGIYLKDPITNTDIMLASHRGNFGIRAEYLFTLD